MSEEPIPKMGSGSTPTHAQQKNKAAPTYVDWGERFHGADSSILGTTAYKACCQCGIELNHRTRFKDSQGRYWCPDCNAVDHERHQPAPCEDCRTAFPRDLMKEDHGKFICEECLGKRLLGSIEVPEPHKPAAAFVATVAAPPARPELSTPASVVAAVKSGQVAAPSARPKLSTPLLVAGLVALILALSAMAYFLF